MADDLSVEDELDEIAGWVAGTSDPGAVRSSIVSRIEYVARRVREAGAPAGDDQLLVVAVRTDGHDLPRRLGQVLAVAHPRVVRGQPLAWAKPISELTAADALLLAGMFGETASVLGVELERLLPGGILDTGDPLLNGDPS